MPGNSFNYVVRQNDEQSDMWYESHYGDSDISSWIESPSAQYAFLGKADDLSEEQCAEIVEEIEYGCYKIYGGAYLPSYRFESSKKSLASLMKSLRCYSVNPFGEETYERDCICSDCLQDNKRDLEEWEAAAGHTGT